MFSVCVPGGRSICLYVCLLDGWAFWLLGQLAYLLGKQDFHFVCCLSLCWLEGRCVGRYVNQVFFYSSEVCLSDLLLLFRCLFVWVADLVGRGVCSFFFVYFISSLYISYFFIIFFFCMTRDLPCPIQSKAKGNSAEKGKETVMRKDLLLQRRRTLDKL